MILVSKSRKKKINVPQSAVSKRLTRVIQSQTVQRADLDRLQYDLSDEPVNGYSRLDSIGRQVDEWNRYCIAKEQEEYEKQQQINRPEERQDDSDTSETKADS